MASDPKKNSQSPLKILKKYKIVFILFFIFIFCAAYTIIPGEDSTATKQFVMNRIINVIDGVGETQISKIKQTDGYTTALIMGIDSRNLEFDGEKFDGTERNTDTIIQAVYDHKNNNIFLISIPRDTGYQMEEECVKQGYDKAINRIYKITEDSDCEESGIEMIKKYTTKITGFENNYFALVSFETFHEVFKVVGEENDGEYGLWIDVPENVYEYYPYGNGFEYFELKKGYQFLDSENLLKFSRARKNSSDFVRARRQQTVIAALKDRILELGVSDPSKINQMYESFRDSALYSHLDLDEIIGGVGLIEELQTAKIYNIVLDNNLGGVNNYIVKPSFSPPDGVHTRAGYYLTTTDYNKECCKEDNYYRVKNYIRSIINNPEISQKDVRVGVYTSDGKFDNLPFVYEEFINQEPPIKEMIKSKFPFKKDLGAPISIIDLSNGEQQEILDYLSQELNAKIISREDTVINPAYKEDIAIILNTQ